jgi:hypothetical protein
MAGRARLQTATPPALETLAAAGHRINRRLVIAESARLTWLVNKESKVAGLLRIFKRRHVTGV